MLPCFEVAMKPGISHPPSLSSDATVDVSILMKSEMDLVSLASLRRYGRMMTVFGRVVTMRTTLWGLQLIRMVANVQVVSQSQPLKLSLDTTVLEVGARDVWIGLNDSKGTPVTGAGVIVGFIDTGIDPYHEDFYLDNGSSKILFIWDQLGGRPSSHPFGYGVEFTRQDIEGRLAKTNDTEGHGTHVAAIAASSGRSSEGTYTGVAPGAWLIIVKAGGRSWICPELWMFNDTDIISGISYLIDKASSLNMRIVINLSLGSNIGSHDGTSPLEVALEEAVERGAVVVTSAGNSADESIHAEGRFSPGKQIALKWTVPDRTVASIVDLWHGPRDSAEVTLVLPSGNTVRGPTGDQGVNTPDGAVQIISQESEKGKGYLIQVIAEGGRIPAGRYSLLINPVYVDSTGEWDAWVDDISPDPYEISEFERGDNYSITQSETVGVPGTSESTITVGAYSGRRSAVGNPPGEVCAFSGRGPTRDGRTKPDLVAPGLFVIAAKSSEAGGLDPYSVDEEHVQLSGTSMSAPHVAGAVALLLQYDPSIPSSSVRDILRSSARLDANTGQIDKGVGDFSWGWGKLDARLALSMVKVNVAVQGIPRYIQVQVSVDGRTKATIAGSGSVTLYLEGGIEHSVSVPSVTGGPWTRYSTPIHEVLIDFHANLSFPYVAEYYVSIVTQYGTSNQSGWYIQGTAVQLMVQPTEVRLAEGHRAALKGWNASVPVIVNGPMVIGAIWVEQFMVEVRSVRGNPTGRGWYDEGASLAVSSEEYIPAEGIMGLLGLRYVLRGWEVDGMAVIDASSVAVHSPLVVVPVYELDYSVTLSYGLILLVAIATAVVVLKGSSRFKRPHEWPPPPGNERS